MPAVKPDATNPHFKNEYVSLDRLLAVTLPILHKHGVVLIQEAQDHLYTRLIHAESGDELAFATPLMLAQETSQAQGSAITYARRYALAAALGVSGEKDDDGEAASKPPRASQKAPKATKPVDAGPTTWSDLKAQIELHVDMWQPWLEAAAQATYGKGATELGPAEKKDFFDRLYSVWQLLQAGVPFLQAFPQGFDGQDFEVAYLPAVAF